MSRPIRISFFVNNPSDAVSFYRCVGPLQDLEKNGHIECKPIQIVNWASMGFCDVFFINRPTSEAHLKAIELARQMGVMVWVDYDDDFYSITPENPAYEKFKNEEVFEIIRRSCLNAHLITVSTMELKRQISMQTLRFDVHVVRNALSKFHKKSEIKERKNQIIWRGTDTHINDLLSHKTFIGSIAENYPQFEWIFLGHNPWYLHDVLKNRNVFHAKFDNAIDYLDFLSRCEASIGIVPLVDNTFNRCKSNIAALEFYNAGITPVVPDWEEWEMFEDKYQNRFDLAVGHAIERNSQEQRKVVLPTLFETNEQRLHLIKRKLF